MDTMNQPILKKAFERTYLTEGVLNRLGEKLKTLGPDQKNGLVELRSGIYMDNQPVGKHDIDAVAMIRNGVPHREGGPAIVINDLAVNQNVTDMYLGKTFLYMQRGVPSRDDGPAIITASGNKLWMKDGALNRENGPAALIDGKPIFAMNGKTMTEQEFGRVTGYGEFKKDWTVDSEGMLVAGAKGIVLPFSEKLPLQQVEVKTVEADFVLPEEKKKEVNFSGYQPLVAKTEELRVAGEKTREQIVKELVNSPPMRAMPEQEQDAIVKALGRHPEMANAQFWQSAEKMSDRNRTTALIRAAQDQIENKPTEKSMRAFKGPEL